MLAFRCWGEKHDLHSLFPSFPLQVHVEQELLIYEAFPYDQQQPQNNLKVRFKKVSLPLKLLQKKK